MIHAIFKMIPVLDAENFFVKTRYTMYRLVHAFRAPSDLVPRRSRGTKSRCEKSIYQPT